MPGADQQIYSCVPSDHEPSLQRAADSAFILGVAIAAARRREKPAVVMAGTRPCIRRRAATVDRRRSRSGRDASQRRKTLDACYRILCALRIIQKYAPGPDRSGLFCAQAQRMRCMRTPIPTGSEGQPGHAITRQGLLDQNLLAID
jgi:hypothetical protein